MGDKKITDEGIVIKPYCPKPRSARETNTELGSPVLIRAKLSIDPLTGDKIAEPGEKIDLNAYVQMSKSSTDIVNIIAKLKGGDETVINVRQGFTGDTTLLPKNINDIVSIEKLSISAKQNFERLPVEVQHMFGDCDGFFNSVLDGSAQTKIDAYIAALQKKSSEAITPKEGQGE